MHADNTGRRLVTTLIEHGGLYCLTGERFSLGRSNVEVVGLMLDSGVKLVQYREKTKKMGEKLLECRKLREMTRSAGAALIINDDIDLALLTGVDGVHIGQEDLPLPEVRSLVGEGVAIGLSTHDPDQARLAVELGADNIGVGPIYSTATKEDVCAPVGLDYLRFVSSELNIPHVAIGGIKEHNIGEVLRAGGRCIAMVTEIVSARDIPARIRALETAMRA